MCRLAHICFWKKNPEHDIENIMYFKYYFFEKKNFFFLKMFLIFVYDFKKSILFFNKHVLKTNSAPFREQWGFLITSGLLPNSKIVIMSTFRWILFGSCWYWYHLRAPLRRSRNSLKSCKLEKMFMKSLIIPNSCKLEKMFMQK